MTKQIFCVQRRQYGVCGLRLSQRQGSGGPGYWEHLEACVHSKERRLRFTEEVGGRFPLLYSCRMAEMKYKVELSGVDISSYIQMVENGAAICGVSWDPPAVVKTGWRSKRLYFVFRGDQDKLENLLKGLETVMQDLGAEPPRVRYTSPEL